MAILKLLWEKWKAFSEIFGNFMSRVILTVLYFVILLPYGIGMRMFADPLELKPRPADSGWRAFPRDQNPEINLTQQY